jgi:hypothetical protein
MMIEMVAGATPAKTKRKGKDSENGEGSKSGMDTESREDSENSVSKN